MMTDNSNKQKLCVEEAAETRRKLCNTNLGPELGADVLEELALGVAHLVGRTVEVHDVHGRGHVSLDVELAVGHGLDELNSRTHKSMHCQSSKSISRSS
jgi:hypothetical protein